MNTQLSFRETATLLVKLWGPDEAKRYAAQITRDHMMRMAGGPGSGRYPKGSGGDNLSPEDRGSGAGSMTAVDAARVARTSDVMTKAEKADPMFQDMLLFAAKQAEDPEASDYEKEHSVVLARAYYEADRPYREINNVGSDAHYQTADGQYTTERQVLHDKIVDGYIAKFGPSVENPRAIMTGGLPGAGKSTGLKYTAGDTSSFTTVNSDDIKTLLPEYNGGAGAAWLHAESDYVARLILIKAVANRQNIVVDVTLKTYGASQTPKLENGTGARLQALNEAGYRTSVVFTDISVKGSARNALNRYVGPDVGKASADGEGRFVPPNYIRGTRIEGPMKTRNRATFEQVKSIPSDWTHFRADENGPRGSKPIFVAEGKNR